MRVEHAKKIKHDSSTPEAQSRVGMMEGIDLVIKIDRKQIVPCVRVESLSPRGTGRARLVLSGKSMEAS